MENFLQACLMLEIFLIMIVGILIPIAAARRRRRRRNPNFFMQHFVAQLPLGTLGSSTVVKQAVTAALETKQKMISVDCQFSIDNYTNTPLDGPLVVGFNHSDYTVGEVQEALDTPVSNQGSRTEIERNRRWVRRVGTLVPIGINDGTIGSMVLRNGQPIRTKLNWVINDGDALEFFALNSGSSGLATGAVLNISGTIHGVWT